MNNYYNIYPENDTNLFSTKEGFEKGNMFQNLYDPYKNINPPKLNPTNERDRLMQQIQELNFAMKDIELYLDTHPEDTNMINKYNEYKREYLQSLNMYEQQYGPITNTSEILNNTPWLWNMAPWPWERTV